MKSKTMICRILDMRHRRLWGQVRSQVLAIVCLSLLFTACRTRTDEDRSEPNLYDLLSTGPAVWRDWSAAQEPCSDSGETMVNYAVRQGRREMLRLKLRGHTIQCSGHAQCNSCHSSHE